MRYWKSYKWWDGQAVGYWQKFQREIIAAETIASNLQIDLKLECEFMAGVPTLGKKDKSRGTEHISEKMLASRRQETRENLKGYRL